MSLYMLLLTKCNGWVDQCTGPWTVSWPVQIGQVRSVRSQRTQVPGSDYTRAMVFIPYLHLTTRNATAQRNKFNLHSKLEYMTCERACGCDRGH